MRKLFIVFLLALLTPTAFAQEHSFQFPAIKQAGPIMPRPDAAYQPNKNDTYKVVFALFQPNQDPSQINFGLQHVAMTYNLYAASGLKPDQIEIAVVFPGPTASITLDNKHYKAKYGVDNPNLKLIKELKEHGVKMAVCGQALAQMEIPDKWVDQHVDVALSGMTTIIEFQHRGYALMPL